MTPPAAVPIEAILARTGALYSLPAVAIEVVQLTESPKVDTRALKECLERDPALAAKLLRVVNSSLFGMQSKIENLTQAIALLGIKPLKLLVLGFSLPDELLEGLEPAALEDYWRGALTRAVAARQIAEQFYQMQGDDPFLAALLQDVGKLVLLQQLGEPYARFLSQVRAEAEDLVTLERQSLGFDHRQLSARLLRQWKLPSLYTDVIEWESGRAEQPESDLVTIVRLANLVADLVSQHRLAVLPELLELGESTCQLTTAGLHDLVARLEPQVAQLADILRVGLGEENSYIQLLESAHSQLAAAAEQAAGDLLAGTDTPYHKLLGESRELATSLRSFVEGLETKGATSHRPPHASSPLAPPFAPPAAASPIRGLSATSQQRAVDQLATVVAACRQFRRPLSLLVVDPTPVGVPSQSSKMHKLLTSLCQEHHLPPASMIPLDESAWALLLPGYERREAVSLAQQLVLDPAPWQAWATELKVGIATVTVIAKGFEPARMLTAAEGCLSAAQASGGSLVKSIEVY